MKRIVAFAFLLGTFAAAGSAQSLRSQIQTSCKQVGKLLAARDVDGFANYLRPRVTSNFKYIEAGKTSGFDQMVAGMRVGLGSMNKVTKAEANVVSLSQKGNSAMAVMRHRMVGTSAGPDKKTHTMAFTGISHDTYVKQGGQWKMSKMAWVKETMTVDGKPMNPGMPPKK